MNFFYQNLVCELNFNIQYLEYFKSFNSPSEVPNLRVRYFSVNIHIPFLTNLFNN